MRGSRSRRSGEVLFGSVGWLFADLMLALVLTLALTAAITASNKPKASSTTSRPTTTTTTPPPTTTTPAPPPRLLPETIVRFIDVNEDAVLRNERGAINDVRTKVQQTVMRALGGRRAGVVLTFGPGKDRGPGIARRVNDVLKSMGGPFADAAFRSYLQTSDPGKVEIEVFLYDR